MSLYFNSTISIKLCISNRHVAYSSGVILLSSLVCFRAIMIRIVLYSALALPPSLFEVKTLELTAFLDLFRAHDLLTKIALKNK